LFKIKITERIIKKDSRKAKTEGENRIFSTVTEKQRQKPVD